MAWLTGEKKFGQYTYDHWYDDERIDVNPQDAKAEAPPKPEDKEEPKDTDN